MMTLKQVEALYWIAKLGGFERAAQKLHTTQSAVSKRIQDLENISSAPIFDRSKRAARLTSHGEALLAICEKMLKLQNQFSEVMKTENLPKRTFKLGITEITVLTWLPTLLVSICEAYPSITLEPEVESSQTLFEKLQQGQLDMIIVPDAFRDLNLKSVPIGEVENAWMGHPSILPPTQTYELKELESCKALTQGNMSGSGLVYHRWLEEHGVNLKWSICSNSLLALMGLTVSGVGISYLPKKVSEHLLKSKELCTIETTPPLPPVPYVAMFQETNASNWEKFVLAEMKKCCDFTKPIFLAPKDYSSIV